MHEKVLSLLLALKAVELVAHEGDPVLLVPVGLRQEKDLSLKVIRLSWDKCHLFLSSLGAEIVKDNITIVFPCDNHLRKAAWGVSRYLKLF